MKVKSITSFGESVVFQMENGETYSMAEIEKHIAVMRKLTPKMNHQNDAVGYCCFPHVGKLFASDVSRIILAGKKLDEMAKAMKPKPLLADAQVGWVCKHRNGDYSTITELENVTFGVRTDYQHKEKVTYSSFTYDGEFGFGMHDLDIISTEPLAEEGTAEWALQMMKIGKRVSATYGNGVYYFENGRVHINQRSYDAEHWVRLQNDIGVKWQICSPQPQVKVGDWVLQSYAAHLQRQVKIVEIAGEKFMARIQGLLLNSWFDMDSIIRKLDNSEVKVSITLSGTVDMSGSDKCLALRYGKGDVEYNLIDFASLTPADAEMVRGLTGGEK